MHQGRGRFKATANKFPVSMDKNRLSVSIFHGYNSIGMKRAFRALPTVNSERPKTLSALKVQNPLLNIIYSPKVIKQMTQDIYRGFPKSVDGFGHYGTTKKIFGNDGIERTLIEIPGTYNGKEGIFEFIIENDGITCSHRFFRVPEK